MNVWYHLSTIFSRRHVLLTAGLIALCVALITTLIFANATQAAPGVNQTISFQGRLSKPTGGIVADGYYNMQFKIYQDGAGTTAGNTGGTLEWTENYINNGGTSGVQVKNGYFSVTLGSVNPFGSSVDWNQDTLWLSMNVAGSATACTTFGSSPCTADGEMLPMKRMTSTPFALNSGMLGGKTADGFIQNTTTAQTADFNITGAGIANTLQGNTSVIAPLFDRANTGTLNIGTVYADVINMGTNNAAHTISIGSGEGNNAITLGSTHGISNTLIQGGSQGVRIETTGGFAVESIQAGVNSILVTTAGSTQVNLVAGESFSVRNSNEEGLLSIVDGGTINLGYSSHLVAQGAATFQNGITVQGGGSLTYQTPGGFNMTTAINIPNYTVGAYNSVLALGLPSTSAATARGILVSDGRTVAHQATIGILSADENYVFGLSYNGTSTGTLSNMGNSVALQGNGLNLLTATNNGGAANVGIGNDASAGYALDVTGSIRASSTIFAPSLDTAAAGTLSVGTTNATTINIGNNSSTTNLSGNLNVTVNNSSTTSMPVNIEQQGSGDAGIGLSTTTSGKYSVGVDATDGKFKVGSSVAAGATSNLGYTTVGASNESNNYQHLQANKYTASQTGTVMNMSVYAQSVDSFCPDIQMAIYADNGSGTAPAALLGSSATTAGVVGWNTLQMTSGINIASGTVYWLAVLTDCDHTLRYTTGTGTRAYKDSVGSLPTPFAADGTTTGQVSLYATIDTSDGTTDSFDGDATIFELGATGEARFQNSTNSATAFEVQNAAGASALTVDTTTNTVLVAGALDTTSAAALTLGSTNATSITIGKTASNIATTVLGTAIFKPTTGNDSTTAFQIQRANGTAMLVADSTNQTITFGNSASGNYTVISTSTGAITKYGTARNTKKITLTAEYMNSVLDAGSGSNNTGTMTSSIDLTNRMNYYKWTTTQGSNQSYDVVVQVPIPTDFDGWASSNPLSISTYTSNTTNGTITLEARDSANAVQCNFVSVTPGSTTTWAANTSACTLTSGTYTAGDYLTFRVRMQSPSGGDVRIGNINLSYLSKY